MASAEFHHFGVPTSVQYGPENYLADAKVYITDPGSNPYRIEFLRFEEGSPLPEPVQKQPHVAYLVPDLEEAIAGKNIVIPPFSPFENLRCAFVWEGNALIELMQNV